MPKTSISVTTEQLAWLQAQDEPISVIIRGMVQERVDMDRKMKRWPK